MTPEQGEAKIRECYPSVARVPAVANLGRLLTRTIILAPLAWLMMSLFYFAKILPIAGRRYTVTNRRLMVRKGWSGKAGEEIPLAEIDEVRVVNDANSDFFRAGNLEIVSKGQVRMTLRGVPEAEAFKRAIETAVTAWVPGRASRIPFVAASKVPAS
jgi:hypothetical protein